MPEFRGKGVAQAAILAAEVIHGSSNWQLDTILQEKANCHLYEKMGYRQPGETQVINQRMTLVFLRKVTCSHLHFQFTGRTYTILAGIILFWYNAVIQRSGL